MIRPAPSSLFLGSLSVYFTLFLVFLLVYFTLSFPLYSVKLLLGYRRGLGTAARQSTVSILGVTFR